ncbi:MAG TPA: YceI family protein [Rhodanobacteraceae bacterium]|nr:YceI family protein [Rhodanobacteraceae bacterium]
MSVRQCVAITLLWLAAIAPASARMLYFRIDPVHTQVIFSVDHDGYSHPVGRMKIKAGWIAFDEDDWSSAKVVADVDTTSVDIGDSDWNDAVTGKRFLDAKDYPLAHFESTSVERAPGLPLHPEGDCPPVATAKIGACTMNAGPRVQRGMMRGNLTIRGVTLPVRFLFNVNRIGATIFSGLQTIAGFSAPMIVLDRRAFGVNAFPKSVGTRVEVRLEVEAILDQDAQKEYEAAMRQSANHAAQH